MIPRRKEVKIKRLKNQLKKLGNTNSNRSKNIELRIQTLKNTNNK